MRLTINRIALLLSVAAAVPAFAQTPTWDTSGNGLLKGTYYFRQVYYEIGYNDGSLYDAAVAYGTVTFDGAGKYGMTASLLDAQSGFPQNVTRSGTYSIAASGYGFLSSPFFNGDTIYGLVNSQGIFIGSATESASGYNDLFIAAQTTTPTATAAAFKGNYSLAYMDLSGGSPQNTLGAMVQMSPNGATNLGTIAVTGYVGGANSKYTQSQTGTYGASNGAMVLNIVGNSQNFFAGQYYLYPSPDGNFVFGGSPNGFDMFVGVRAPSGTPTFSGLYYQAGMDQDESQLVSSGYAILDTYYGSLNASAGAIVGHQRLLELLATGGSYDFTYGDSYTLSSSGTYSNGATSFVVGAGGIRIAGGIWPYLGINVAVPAPSFTPGGVYLNPTGIVNAASSAPFTARVAPGELLTLYGSNLASGFAIAQQAPFTTSLNNVQVMVNGVAAPIYYVSATQLSVIVPYGVTGTIAQFQVNNNGTLSNIVTMPVGTTAPGVFTVPAGGLGYGAILHSDYSLVTTKNPAQIGETVQVYLTGLGAVSPAISDGAAGPTGTLSVTPANAISADISGTQATVQYSGLAPGLAGLYQVNVTIPSGLTAGDNSLDIAGPDSYTTEVTIPIGSGSSGTSETAASTALANKGAHKLQHRQQSKGRAIR